MKCVVCSEGRCLFLCMIGSRGGAKEVHNPSFIPKVIPGPTLTLISPRSFLWKHTGFFQIFFNGFCLFVNHFKCTFQMNLCKFLHSLFLVDFMSSKLCDENRSLHRPVHEFSISSVPHTYIIWLHRSQKTGLQAHKSQSFLEFPCVLCGDSLTHPDVCSESLMFSEKCLCEEMRREKCV